MVRAVLNTRTPEATVPPPNDRMSITVAKDLFSRYRSKMACIAKPPIRPEIVARLVAGVLCATLAVLGEAVQAAPSTRRAVASAAVRSSEAFVTSAKVNSWPYFSP